MVEFRYDEHYERVDLMGKSVAEARELYKSRLDIPDRAHAYVNGEQLKKKLESETQLRDRDELLFEAKDRKGEIS